jgi:hypothetical protein
MAYREVTSAGRGPAGAHDPGRRWRPRRRAVCGARKSGRAAAKKRLELLSRKMRETLDVPTARRQRRRVADPPLGGRYPAVAVLPYGSGLQATDVDAARLSATCAGHFAQRKA